MVAGRQAVGMETTTISTTTDPYTRHTREIAAAVTLPAAARALVAPEDLSASGAVAVTTACGALATRLALVRFLADPGPMDAADVRPLDPFSEPTPSALHGSGPEPDRDRVRTAGDRCVEAWRRWTRSSDSGLSEIGVAGALALGAWCSWALGSELRATTRARHALAVRADDPLAGLVLRTCRAGARAAWRR
ncbi:hypothetical protein DEJ16_08305 [Curtobacterium sp. MCJR17_055]|nr:hypothetical protein DEI87_07995 [Curtobacterium sp. MCBD17_029]PYY55511.1 hypothetical protein DEJ16_08305 [Curtobacterium sp. MCJR17_055]PYY60258.1 hypothetical protein DEJ26_05425 [Curtobacterium sp. MCPF17_015]